MIKKFFVILYVITALMTCETCFANQWNSNSLTDGSIPLGGRLIYLDSDTRPKWAWRLGGYSSFSHTTKDMSEDGKKITISAPHNILLLAGKSLGAFEGATSGSGIVPVFKFMAENNPVQIQWINGSEGKGIITLPLHNKLNNKYLGTGSLHVQAFGALAWTEYDGFGARITQTLGNNSTYPYVFNGGLMGANSWTTKNGLDFISQMTGNEVDAAYLWGQLRDRIAALDKNPVISNESGYQDLIGEGWFYSAAYSLGIPVGEIIELFFSSKVTEETQWQSRLTVEIIYS